MDNLFEIVTVLAMIAIGIYYSFFAVYSFINRKTLTLGYANKPATTLDFIIIYAAPFLIFYCAYFNYALFFEN